MNNAEKEIINEIKRNNGFTIWWATENQGRAETIDRLEADGVIIRKESPYPFEKFELNEDAI